MSSLSSKILSAIVSHNKISVIKCFKNMNEQSLSLAIVPVNSIESEPSFRQVKQTPKKWLQETSKNTDMDTIFFHNDRFELIVDARGYRPEDLRCIVNPQSIEVSGIKCEIGHGSNRQMETCRNYELPSPIVPQQAVCCLSSDGILLVAVPWQK